MDVIYEIDQTNLKTGHSKRRRALGITQSGIVWIVEQTLQKQIKDLGISFRRQTLPFQSTL